jgi:lactoylglutathione lyase
MIRRLAHLCFVTEKLQPMVDFYTESLGLTLKFHFEHADGGVFGAYIDCGDDTFLEIFDNAGRSKQWGGGKTPAPLTRGNQYAHFCLEVTGLADLKAKLESRGVKIGDIKRGMDHSLQAWLADPDGNQIELMEYTAQSLQIQRHGDLVCK